MIRLYLICSFVVFLSCTSNTYNKADEKAFNRDSVINSVNEKGIEDIATKTTELVELFVDSIEIGRKKLSKIVIEKIIDSDSLLSCIKFFEKKNNIWNFKQTLSFSHSEVSSLSPDIVDMNNDGYNDLMYSSQMSNRGANIVKNLLLFDPVHSSFKWIKNSEWFPNLEYNQDLDCVNGLIFTGSLETLFLRIENDSLVHFASVTQDDSTITSYLVNNGTYQTLKVIPNKGFSDFAKFKNFNPIQE